MASNRLTTKRRAVVVKALETMSIKEAMTLIGLDRRSYYLWREEDPTFAHDCDVARALQVEVIDNRLSAILQEGAVENQIKRGGVGPNAIITETTTTRKWYPSTMLRYLERRHPDYQGHKFVAGDMAIALPEAGRLDISKLTAGEQREFARLLRKCGAIVSHRVE